VRNKRNFLKSFRSFFRLFRAFPSVPYSLFLFLNSILTLSEVNIPLRIQTLLLILAPLAMLQARTSAAGSNTAPGAALVVTSEPEVIVNGSPCLFRVESRRPLRSLSGKWQRRNVFFNFDKRDGRWYGFAGVGLDAVAGRSRLALEATPVSGARFTYTHPVMIERESYPIVSLRVPNQYTEPDDGTLARIQEEQALKKDAFARVSPSRLWSGSFAAPVESAMTSEFGVRRRFNHKVRSVHQGMDLRAETGTPVGAMNSGLVIVAREMFYEGGFVVIDHGQGLLTLYMHLSEISVKEGDHVGKQQIFALSGGTGRATAPHLHVGVRWQGIYIDPAVLLTLPLP
jgi:murein DD-endopeptidase MepM/ murein hydrolase activator NlpD